jgi:hypothetical protein
VEYIAEEYGISRSSRRGATLEAVNQGVTPDVRTQTISGGGFIKLVHLDQQ